MHGLTRRNALLGIVLGVGSALAAGSRSTATERAPLAIRGYDTVAYFTMGGPARGLPEFEYEWDEYRYLFSSAVNRQMFMADPVRYAPQFANLCAVALTRGELDEANPEYWLISDGKLYLFGKPIGPGVFSQNLAENVAKATLNRPVVQKH